MKHLNFNFLIKATVLSLVANSFYIFANYYAVSKNGSVSYLFLASFLILTIFASVLISTFSLLSAINKKARPRAINIFLASVIFTVSAIICIRIGGYIRDIAFDQLSMRSSSLVAAIKYFEKENQTPPENLPQLVPQYINQIPTTEMGAYPKYEYYTGKESLKFNNNPWALVIKTPLGGINWDIFIYLPLQNYPQKGFGGSVEIFNDWAYVHE